MNGANINYQDKWGNTPLMLAINNQNHESIHSLLKNGCDQTIPNKYGLTPKDKVINYPSILQFLDNFSNSDRKFPKFKVKLQL
jgi:ankyrin repeat protein